MTRILLNRDLYGPEYVIFWYVVHVFMRMYILLLLGVECSININQVNMVIVLLKSFLLLPIFLLILSINEGVFKSHTIIVDLSISPCSSISSYSMSFKAVTRPINIWDRYVLLIDHFIIMTWPPSLVMFYIELHRFLLTSVSIIKMCHLFYI